MTSEHSDSITNSGSTSEDGGSHVRVQTFSESGPKQLFGFVEVTWEDSVFAKVPALIPTFLLLALLFLSHPLSFLFFFSFSPPYLWYRHGALTQSSTQLLGNSGFCQEFKFSGADVNIVC